MRTIAIIGAHGKIGRLATLYLSGAGHRVLGVVRNPQHGDDVAADGGEPILFDLEHADAAALAAAIKGADSLIFTAGSGGGSGTARKDTVDRAGAVTSMEAAALGGIRRFVQVSYLGADEPPADGAHPDMVAYQKAKHAADEALRASDLAWTIVRPGLLNDDERTDRVSIDANTTGGTTSRSNTAALLSLLATTDRATHLVLNVVDGDTPLEEATPR